MSIKDTTKNIARDVIDGFIYTESLFYKSGATNNSTKNNGTKTKVLILRKDGLGDCVLFLPALKAYRKYFIDTELTVIMPKIFQSLSPLLSDIDRIIWFDAKSFGSNFSYRRKFLLDLKRAGYNLAIYPTSYPESIGDLMLRMTDAKEIYGWNTDESFESTKRNNLSIYSKLIGPVTNMTLEVERNKYFFEKVTGQKMTDTLPRIDLSSLPNVGAQELIKTNSLKDGCYAVIFPGSREHWKIWPGENFAKVITHIAQKGIIPVLCGGNSDIDIVNKIKSIIKGGVSKAGVEDSQIIDLTGKTDIATLTHIISKAKLYFGSDTGAMHIATAVGTPTIGITGSISFGRFFPYGDPRKNTALYDETKCKMSDTGPLGNKNDINSVKSGEIHPSIKNITVESALVAIDKMLS